MTRGSGLILPAQPAFLPSVTSSFFAQNEGGWAGGKGLPGPSPLDPPLEVYSRIFDNTGSTEIGLD